MVDWEKVQWGSVAQWASVVATTVAVIVALFKEQIISRLRRPELTIRALQSPPDSDKIPIFYPMLDIPLGYKPIYRSADSYFLRLWIQNEGKSRAEKVQVFAEKLLRKTANGSFVSVDSFLPMNLRWGFGTETPTHTEVFADGISPKMGVHCNLAHVTNPAQRKELGEDHPDAKAGQTVLHLETELKPSNFCHVLAPGTYHLNLRIAGANCKPTSHTVELTLTGEWYEEKERMFQDGVTMRVINES